MVTTTIRATATAVTLLLLLLFSSPPPSSAFPFSSNPWTIFQNLSGCNPGDYDPLLPNLKSYLQRFGYLPPSPSNFSDFFDSDLAAALLSYQRNLGLIPTGLLDPSTLSLLSRPRCGMPDTRPNSTAVASADDHGRHLYSYFTGTPTWSPDKRVLTYALTPVSSVTIDIETLRPVFARAFARWAAASTLNFTEVSPDSDDIDLTVGFYSGDHGDGEPFDGVLGTLGHAFSPMDGRLHFDAAEEWVASGDVTKDGSANAVDLESVAVHEIGHLLGLGHSSVAEAVMYPAIGTRTRKVELARDDVDGIQGLYGGNPSYQFQNSPAGRSSNEASGGEVASPSPVVALLAIVGLLVWVCDFKF